MTVLAHDSPVPVLDDQLGLLVRGQIARSRDGVFLPIMQRISNAAELFRSVTAHGLEGIVGKRLTSPYVAGRSKDWLKVRASTAREQSRR